MAFELEDRWVWDSWMVEHLGLYHLFYLQAPRSLEDPELRHRNALIGHATSTDLVNWSEVGVALEPGPSGDWDDFATWTGCVVSGADLWWMFYTGASHRDDGLVQRIGAAFSRDLIHWTKHPNNPLVEADPKWYETLDLDVWHDLAWRDPWVYPVENGYEMLITARVDRGSPRERGVIGRAFSRDLARWSVQPPLTQPGGFGHMEVPQRERIGERDVLFFSCGPDLLAPSRLSGKTPTSSCYALPLDAAVPVATTSTVALDLPNLYSARVVEDPAGEWVVLGFELDDGYGGFAGRISDPIPLREIAPALFRGS